MIKFFRHIRQTLLEQNQMGKYAKYAIGEIILVVIGILIALQINTANENNKKKKLEQTLLKELTKEIQFNKYLLEDSRKTHKMHDSINNAILSGNYNENPVELLSLSFLVTFYRTTDFVNGTSDAILSEYGPSIISNDSIREFVTSWRDMENDITENEKIEQDLIVNHMFRAIGKFVDYKEVFALGEQRSNLKSALVSNPRLSSNLKQLLNDQEFSSLVYTKYFNDEGIESDIKPVLEKMSKVLTLINKELQKTSM